MWYEKFMHIKIKLFATLVNYIPGTVAGVPFDFELADKATISKLVESLKIPRKEAAIIFVNGKNKTLQHELNNGDEVSIFPLIGGG